MGQARTVADSGMEAGKEQGVDSGVGQARTVADSGMEAGKEQGGGREELWLTVERGRQELWPTVEWRQAKNREELWLTVDRVGARLGGKCSV